MEGKACERHKQKWAWCLEERVKQEEMKSELPLCEWRPLELCAQCLALRHQQGELWDYKGSGLPKIHEKCMWWKNCTWISKLFRTQRRLSHTLWSTLTCVQCMCAVRTLGSCRWERHALRNAHHCRQRGWGEWAGQRTPSCQHHGSCPVEPQSPSWVWQSSAHPQPPPGSDAVISRPSGGQDHWYLCKVQQLWLRTKLHGC